MTTAVSDPTPLDAVTPVLGASTTHVMARLELVEVRVRELVGVRRAVDADPDDLVRGLYISEDDVDQLLGGPRAVPSPSTLEDRDEVEHWADEAEQAGADLRLRRLALAYGLDDADVDALLLTMAVDLDARFERLYGYLQDDVTKRRPGIGLAHELLGLSPLAASARRRFASDGPLLGPGLLEVEDADRPFLTRSLRVPDRVTSHLLGDDGPHPALTGLLAEVPLVPSDAATAVGRLVTAGRPLVHVRESARRPGVAVAVAGLAEAGWASLTVDLTAAAGADLREVVRLAALEAGLQGRGLVLRGIDTAVDGGSRALDVLEHAGGPVVLVGSRAWDPRWTHTMPVSVAPHLLTEHDRVDLWDHVAPDDLGFDPAAETVSFRLRPDQVLRAWHAAVGSATARGGPVRPDDLRVGARAQNAGALEDLARRLEPRATFADLVVPDRIARQLREIVERARHRPRVLDEWGVGGSSDKGRGITALFAGPSGTGKTLAAEVVGGALGLDVYVIDLSSVVDKYIGETEKNLERIFDQAEDVNGILFFDEADALFGKRSEVSDAKDRYANVETAYLLQRMERFDGITVLATNLRANLDEAFTRRIDVLIDFPPPKPPFRRRLWELHLPPELPTSGEIDLDHLAGFELAGGDIRNVTVAAAYAAAAGGHAVTHADLVRATAREFRKLGRLVTESEFGEWMDALEPPRQPQEVTDDDPR